MEQLLQISTVKSSLEYHITDAAVKYNNHRPSADVTRERGGFQMKSDVIQMKMDGQKMRDSIGLKMPDTIMRDYMAAGKRAVQEAIAEKVREGYLLMDGLRNSPASIQASKNPNLDRPQLETVFLPSSPPEISWEGGTVDIKYTPDKLNYKWNVEPNHTFEYTRGEVELKVAQYPKVNIEYVGEPHYVPDSANPKNIGLDIKV